MRPLPGWFVLVLLMVTLLLLSQSFSQEATKIPYSFFQQQLLERNVRSLEIQGQQAHGEFRLPPLQTALKQHADGASAVATSTDSQASNQDAPAESSTPADQEPAERQEVPFQEQKPSQEQKQPPEQQTQSQEAVPPVTESPVTESQAVTTSKEGDEPRLDHKFVVTLLSPWIEAETAEFWRQQGVEKIVAVERVDYSGLLTVLWLAILLLFLVGMWLFIRRTRDQMMGGGMFGGVMQSPAKRYQQESTPRVDFDSVAGLEGVKQDLKEVIAFLKNPEQFQRLGARVPKGVLLMGPPGTGKTLLAKAVAGEAGVPFYSISGSEFIQLFVGVGASRVRDMFKTAKANSPAILFIDEIDAVGRQRGAGLGGGHDEREQTLNQILSEMDGFESTTSVIVIAATNRPDVLDPALLRPGRFDRHITVERPSLEARRELFEVHTHNVPVAEDVDFDRLARTTVGLTGADIQNLVNEAALWATRQKRNAVTKEDFEYARDKVLMGSARDELLTDEEKRITAYHEAGHTLLAWYLPGLDRVHKVTIIPRGRALGVTQLMPEEDRHNVSEPDLQARLAMSLAGRAAEKLVFDEVSAGAENDLKQATDLARRMVMQWGMSERLGPVAYQLSDESPFLGREMAHEQRHYSEHTARIIDEEVAKILHAAADSARRTLAEHMDHLTALAEALLEKEVLAEEAIAEILGPSVDRQAALNPGIVAVANATSPVRRREE